MAVAVLHGMPAVQAQAQTQTQLLARICEGGRPGLALVATFEAMAQRKDGIRLSSAARGVAWPLLGLRLRPDLLDEPGHSLSLPVATAIVSPHGSLSSPIVGIHRDHLARTPPPRARVRQR